MSKQRRSFPEVRRIRILISELNDTYPASFEQLLGIVENGDAVVRVDLKDLPGTNMYCSDEAYSEIRKRLSEYDHPEEGIHFIDTGNYHYMSRIFTSFIDEKYDLIMFDHHTDMQESAFGDVLSCGSWVKAVLENDSNISSVLVIGPPKHADGGIAEAVCAQGISAEGCRYFGIPEENTGTEKDNAYSADDNANKADSSLPVYLSIDKDILDVSECITNWDQGELKLEELKKLVCAATNGRRVIGADICGGISESDPDFSGDASALNLRSDRFLYSMLNGIMK